MAHAIDRAQARLALEICRFTYAMGAGGPENEPARVQSLRYIRANSQPAADPIPIQDKGGTSFACVVPYADRNVVSYMGTESEFDIHDPKQLLESLKDWGQNGRAAPTDFVLDAEHLGKSRGMKLAGRVHRGFLGQLKLVQAEVVRTLETHGGRDRPVLVTGHSQGGAEAALATRAFAAAGFPVEATYTFAAPRAASAEVAAGVTAPVHRFEFGDDIVPHMPPTLIRHVLEEVLLKRIEAFPRLVEAGLRALLNSVFARLSDFGYVGLGPLYYGWPDDGQLRGPLDAAREQALFGSRLSGLKQHSKNWADHHHLAGTDAEVKAGRRGTYTALVSDWPLANPA